MGSNKTPPLTISCSSFSTSSSLEHQLNEMVVSSPFLEDHCNQHVENVSKKQSGDSSVRTTPQFAETSACRSDHFSTGSTQLSMTQASSTLLSTVNRTEAKPTVSLATHVNDTQSSSSASFMAFAVADGEEQVRVASARQLTSRIRNSTKEIDTTSLAESEQDTAEPDSEGLVHHQQHDQKPPSFSLPQNKSSESLETMSVSTPTSPPNDTKMTPKKKQRRDSKSSSKEGQSTGRWTEEEHQTFLLGLHSYGREWKKVASHIPTRTSAQVRSHAQKYFAKLQREEDCWIGGVSGTESPALGTNAALGQREVHGSVGFSVTEETPSVMSNAVQENVARILAHPESVESEVEDTLRQLRERYHQLQRRLEQTSPSPLSDAPHRKRRNPYPVVPSDDQSSTTSLSAASLQNEELIALSVLHGDLPRGDASTGASELSEDNMEVASQPTASTGSISKRTKRS